MPILGITASQISGHLAVPDTGAMFPLGMVQVGSGGSSTITFSSIPSTYKHLQLRIFFKNPDTVFMTLNSTNATKGHYLYGDGSSVAAGVSATNFIANSSSSQFGSGVVDILDYTNTNKLITVRTLAGWDNNGSGQLSLNSELYNLSSTAVNTITLTPGSSTFSQYSSFALYGIL